MQKFELDIDPERQEFVPEKSDLDKGIVVYQPKDSTLNYDLISTELYRHKSGYFIGNTGLIIKNNYITRHNSKDLNNGLTQEQLRKALALNKLFNIALYLNEDWKPNWYKEEENKYYIYSCGKTAQYTIGCCNHTNTGTVYFKTPELAEKAMKIMGDDLRFLFYS